MKIFQPNQNRNYIYNWQVYIAVATSRKVQNPSLCAGVKGNKNAKQSLLQQGLGIMMKQHQQCGSTNYAVAEPISMRISSKNEQSIGSTPSQQKSHQG